MKANDTTDALTGTVKGPGERPHEFLFITADHARARVGEFVYYTARDGQEERRIIGNVTGRRLVRNLPDTFLSDPETPPALVSSLIGLDGEGCELYEITVETVGYFSRHLGDFVNPRIPPRPGDPVFLASSQTLSDCLSPRHAGETGSAHVGSLLTREAGEVPVVLSIKDVVSTHLAILASTGAGKSYTAGVLVEELMMPYNRAAVLVVDPHGEYDTLRSIETDARFSSADGEYRPEVKVFTHERVKVRFSSLTEADIKYLLPEGTSDKMLHFLSQAFRQLTATRQNELWGYHDLRDEVKAQKYEGDARGESSNASSIEGLLWRLDSRFDKPNSIFSDSEHIPLAELFLPGRCTVLQLSDIEQNEQQVVVATLLRRVNPIDQDTVAKSVEGAGRQLLQELPALTKGQAVISGVGVNTPVMCRVRERITRHGGETFDAPSEWARWHTKEEREHREQDSAVLASAPAKPKKAERVRGFQI